MTNATVLVAAGSGVAGSAVIREFVRHKRPVRALVKSRARARAFAAFPTVEIAEGDLSRPETLTAALSGMERVLLVSSAKEQMLKTQTAFIDAAKSAGVPHIVKFSGLSAADVGSPFIFGTMHADIDRYLEGSGRSWGTLL